MNSEVIRSLRKPLLYEKSKAAFWDDEYISKQMLDAHLDPDFEAASRKLDFIEKSALWIKKIVPPSQYPVLLDIGCGPGIYDERFTKMGYQVTGVDFSKRSINYAEQSAKNKELEITYIYQNYLDMDFNVSFDLCTLIYCDYGALSTEDRQNVMKKVYDHLKPGGKFILDVFTLKFFDKCKEQQTWEYHRDGGFWRAGEYIELNALYKYTDNVTLKLTSVITENEVIPYYIWDTYFTKKLLVKESEEAGFKVCQIFSDVAGSAYDDNSETMAIILEKPLN